MEILTGEMNFRISQEMNSIINGMNSQIERAISSAISERIIPQMQNVVENVLARELRDVPNVSGRLHIQTDEAQNNNRDNLRDLDPSLDLNGMETEEVSPHSFVAIGIKGHLSRCPTKQFSGSSLFQNLPNIGV